MASACLLSSRARTYSVRLAEQLRQPRHVDCDPRSSSFVSTLAQSFGLIVAWVDVNESLAVSVTDDMAASYLVGAPRWRKAARHGWLLVFLPGQRRKHRAPVLGQGEFARGVALDHVVTAAPAMPARYHSVLLAMQNSSRPSGMLSARARAVGRSGFGFAMR
jgi:hypothetical protein